MVVNLTAFETFFPEKRLFFLEGREVLPRLQTRFVRRRLVQIPSDDLTFNPEPTTFWALGELRAPSVETPMGVIIDSVDLTRPTDLKVR